MCLIWLTSCSDYFLITFLVNTFKRVYVCAVASSISENLAYPISGVFYAKFGAKASFMTGNGIAAVFGVLILAYGLDHQDDWTFVFLVLFAKFGIACCMSIVYIAHRDIFPDLFAARALGYCNVLARIFSSTSSLLAGMEEPLPIWVFTVTAAISTVAALALVTKSE